MQGAYHMQLQKSLTVFCCSCVFKYRSEHAGVSKYIHVSTTPILKSVLFRVYTLVLLYKVAGK